MAGPPDVTLRRARHEDWPGVQALLREIDELHAALAPSFFRSAPRAEMDWRRLLAYAHAAVFVSAEATLHPVVGLIVVRLYDTPAEQYMQPRRRGHVETVVVTARRRRRGIGRRLLEAASDWARRQGAVEMVLTTWAGNEAADAFYERLGYRVLSSVLHAPL